MTNKTTFIMLYILSTISMSCKTTRAIYSSPIPNAPILQDKNDASISFQTSGKLASELEKKRWGGDIQAAYSPIKHLGVTYSFSYRKERDEINTSFENFFNQSSVKYLHNHHEFGFGFYHEPNVKGFKSSNASFGENALVLFQPFLWLGNSIFRDTRVGFSLYGGFGFGFTELNENGLDKNNLNYNRFLDTRFTKFYIQPTLRFYKSEHFSFAFTLKYSHLNFNRFNNNYNLNEVQAFNLDKVNLKQTKITEFYTNITYRIPDAKWLQLQLNLGFSGIEGLQNNSRGATASVAVYVNPFELLKKKGK